MRKRIVIKGTVVQDIGYRLFLYEYADEADVTEFQTRNVKEGVEVLVGGEDGNVDTFVDFVKTERPEEADVKAVEVEEYQGKIRPIERFAQGFMLAQMGKFVNIGMEMLATEKGIKRDTGMMLDKQDMTLDKQDMTLDKQDMTLEKQKETIKELKGVREDLKAYMEERFERIEREITDIKAKIEFF